MKSDIKLDSKTHDLSLEGGSLQLFKKQENSVQQRLKIGLALVQGEWFLNTSKGLPLTDPIFSQKDSQPVLDSYIRKFIEDFDGVEELLTYGSELNRVTRSTTINFSARTTSGEILSFTEEVI